MRQAVRALASTMALAVLLGVALGYGGALIFALDGLAHFRLHFLLALAPVACLALLVREWRAVFRCGVAGVLAIAGLGVMWETPAPPVASNPDAPAITVMTANLYQRNPQPELMRAALRAQDADILITNETGRSAVEGLTSLADQYPYHLVLTTRGRALRTVIWSKFPIRDGTLYLEDKVEPTGARAIVSLNPGFEIGILGVHFAHAVVGNQDIQIEALDTIAEDMPPTRIVLGDLNITPWSWAMLRTEELTGTRRVPGYRVTWRGSYYTPFGNVRALIGQPIDHVLISPDLSVEDVHTVAIPGSDHRGVVARLRLPVGAGLSLKTDPPYVERLKGGRDAVGHSRDRAVGRDVGAAVRRLSFDFREPLPGSGSDGPGDRRTGGGWGPAKLP
ncbi:MAG: endonuclease/exonuclease/phosphatase family protein [Pseudomonadota bacterium]